MRRGWTSGVPLRIGNWNNSPKQLALMLATRVRSWMPLLDAARARGTGWPDGVRRRPRVWARTGPAHHFRFARGPAGAPPTRLIQETRAPHVRRRGARGTAVPRPSPNLDDLGRLVGCTGRPAVHAQ